MLDMKWEVDALIRGIGNTIHDKNNNYWYERKENADMKLNNMVYDFTKLIQQFLGLEK